MNKSNSEWWDSYFGGIFDRYRYTLKIVIILSFISRIIICLLLSFDVGSQAHHIELLFIKVFLYFLLKKAGERSIMFKKILLFSVIEVLNFVYRYFSFSTHQEEFAMYCILSTVFIILFQTSIFQNNFHTGIIALKHIYL